MGTHQHVDGASAQASSSSTGTRSTTDAVARAHWNGARWAVEESRGHYESWFVRANHPTRALGFWIRYTIFSPAKRPADAEGELWAVFFNGETGANTAARDAWAAHACTFSPTELGIQLPGATMRSGQLQGCVESSGHRLVWDLRHSAAAPPLLLLDRSLYRSSFPKAKAVVPVPLARFEGSIVVDGEAWPVGDWVGSQCHNWGTRHTDRYAWGQVVGFDGEPEVMLEVATAQVRLGPVLTPPLTVLVLRLDGEEYALNTLLRAAFSRGTYDHLGWRFVAQDRRIRLDGTIVATPADFVALPYRNPPGGVKTCLNTKIARCDLVVRRPGHGARSLCARSRAAFEVLT